MIKRNSGNSVIYWLGSLLLALLVARYLRQLKINNPPIKMTIINKMALDVYFLLIAKGFNFKLARFITAQAGHETGNFKSKIFIENNNCFGMKLALIRKTTAIKERYGHAVYIDLESCIEDFRLYYKSFKYLSEYSSLAEYVKAIKKRNYFEADETAYLLGCIHFFKLYFETPQNVS